jgi:hypothetical protein
MNSRIWPIVPRCFLLALVFSLSLASSVSFPAEPKWMRMQSPNFEVLSSASERETRNTLHYFEQVREFFLKFNGRAPKEPAPVTIVIFGSEKEYAPYSMNQVAIAYFMPRGDRDYIVMGRTGELAEKVAVHEYTHLVAQHAGLRYPPWLNEGLAELFSTFTINKDSIFIGDPIPERILALRNDHWVPLATIMGADRDSPYYNEAGKAGSLYNQGWAAVHLIGTTKEYRPKFAAFLTAIASGKSSADALQSVYGKSLSAFEAELRGYIGQGSFNHLVGKIEIDRTKKEVTSQPATPFDVKLALTDIDSRPNAAAERRRVLEELKVENSKRPEPWAGLAYLDWQAGKPEKAAEGFAKAYELGARSNRLLWDYGRMVQSAKPQESIKVLKELAALEPNRVEIRIELAWSQYYARQINDSLATLGTITLESTDQAPRFFSLVGYVKLGLGDYTATANAVALVRQFAKTDEDRFQADRLNRLLVSTQAAAALAASRPPASSVSPAVEVTTAPASELLPEPNRPLPPPTVVGTIKPAVVLSSVSGTLAEFICPANGSTGFKFAIDTPEGKKVFSFKTPESISIRGKEDNRADLYCGKQEEKSRVLAEYQETAEPGVDGALKILTFNP